MGWTAIRSAAPAVPQMPLPVVSSPGAAVALASAGSVSLGGGGNTLRAPGTPPYAAFATHTRHVLADCCPSDDNGCRGVELRPLEGESLGCEVLGLDLMAHPLTPQLVAALRQAFLRHQVLVFRGQEKLSPERHVEFSRRFGGLYRHVIGEFRLPGHEEIVVVSNEVDNDGKVLGLNGLDEEASKNGRRHFWHSDLSYMAAPPMGSMLHIKTRPPSGDGDTLFANMYAAHDALEPELQRELRALNAHHLFMKNADVAALAQITPEQKETLKSVPQVTHPVVRTHPESGKRALFVSEGFTSAIEGWEPEVSEALLQRLHAHCTQPRFVYRHKWQEGDLVFWDNRCTLHFATGSKEPRTLYRTTIKGDEVF